MAAFIFTLFLVQVLGMPPSAQAVPAKAAQHRGMPLMPGSPDFIADEEARDYLCSLGLEKACASQAFLNNSSEYFGFTNLHRQYPEPCQQAPDRLVFHHVMKSGGVSVRKFLECICTEKHCSILRMDGKREMDKHLDQRCEPTVCTSHADSHHWDDEDRCGSGFHQAKQFTVLRHPVERVWSFYTYLRRYYKPFQERSLVSILRNLGKEDLDEGLPAGERCKYCSVQLKNQMTRGMFCGMLPEECDDLRSGRATREAEYDSLEAAKVQVSHLSAIFLFEDINEFPAAFQRSGLPLHVGAARMCSIGQDNPTPVESGEKLVLDDEARDWIELVNRLDIQLYHYARSLGTVVRPQ